MIGMRLYSHRENSPAAGRGAATIDAAASMRQYPPAITEGGFPAGRWITGAAAAHLQIPKAVPSNSSSAVIKKEDA